MHDWGDVPSDVVCVIVVQVSAVNQHVDSLRGHAESPEYDTEKGISLLELKTQLLLSYVVNLSQLMLLKTEGHSISGCPAVERLVEIRTVLEKVRPLDQKLRYQIDKLIRTATTGLAGGANDPLCFKPNPSNLVSKLEEEESSDDEEGEGSGQPKPYVPPKMVAMPYAEEGGGKQQREEERQRQKALRSSLVRELRSELMGAPEEIHDTGGGLRRQKEVHQEKEQEMYEEDNFIRLSAKRRKSDGGRGTQEAVEELTDFDDLRQLTRQRKEGDGPSRKRKFGGKGKMKRKGFKRRR